MEKHLGGAVVHIKLANQVSFLNRAALLGVLDGMPRDGQVLLDARETDYIDPDILDLLRDFAEVTAPARGIEVSRLGFDPAHRMPDLIRYVDHSSRELQDSFTPKDVLGLFRDGHERFRTGRQLTRDLGRQMRATAGKQHPLAVVLSCIDSRAPSELIFDLGLGDILNIRVAGNVISGEVLGSMEYACEVAGARLILVMGHTRCGAVTAAVDLAGSPQTVAEATGCEHLEPIIQIIQQSVGKPSGHAHASPSEKEAYVNGVARANVEHVTDMILSRSRTINKLHGSGRVAIVGAIYDVTTGNIEFLPHGDACAA